MLFQSTLPCGSDCLSNRVDIHHANFNPRSLAGATTSHVKNLLNFNNFNPRSLAGATWVNLCGEQENPISIHAPLRERLPRVNGYSVHPNFNPRSLAGATNLPC